MGQVERWSRRGDVSVRRQLAARLEASILEGDLPPGRRLPGIRSLARRMGVHRHTAAAAYRDLAAAGCVVTVPGSGTYVADAGGTFPQLADRERGPGIRSDIGRAHDARRSFVAFLRQERIAGTRGSELEELFASWMARRSSGRVLLVEPEAGLRRILLHELRRALRGRVEATVARGLRDPAGPVGVPVARPPVLAVLRTRLPPGTEALPLALTGGGKELGLVRRLPPRSVVAVVTRSRAVRRRARELLVAEIPRGTGLLLPAPEPGRGLARALRIARVLFVDALCAEMPELRGSRRKVELRLLAPAAVAALRGWLERPEGSSWSGEDARESTGGPRDRAG